MVRDFFESFLVCSKLLPNRTGTTNYIHHRRRSAIHRQTLDGRQSRLNISKLLESESNRRNHSVTDCPVDNVSILQDSEHRTAQKRNQFSSPCAPLASSEQANSHLDEDILCARTCLIRYQALDKWVEKWQEAEFKRIAKRRVETVNRLADSLRQSGLVQSTRTRRKLAQGRALSERAKLSARHCQRRDQLIRKVLEAVGQSGKQPTPADVRSKSVASETLELLSENLTEVPLLQSEPNKLETKTHSPVILERIVELDRNLKDQSQIDSAESPSVQMERSEHLSDQLLESSRELNQTEPAAVIKVPRVSVGDNTVSICCCYNDDRKTCACKKTKEQVHWYDLSSDPRHQQDNCGDGLERVPSRTEEQQDEKYSKTYWNETIGRMSVTECTMESVHELSLIQKEQIMGNKTANTDFESSQADELSGNNNNNSSQTGIATDRNMNNTYKLKKLLQFVLVQSVANNSSNSGSNFIKQKEIYVSGDPTQHELHTGKPKLLSKSVISQMLCNQHSGSSIVYILYKHKGNKWTEHCYKGGKSGIEFDSHLANIFALSDWRSRVTNESGRLQNIWSGSQQNLSSFKNVVRDCEYRFPVERNYQPVRTQNAPHSDQSRRKISHSLAKKSNEASISTVNQVENESELSKHNLCPKVTILREISFNPGSHSPVQFLAEDSRIVQTSPTCGCNSPFIEFVDTSTGNNQHRGFTTNHTISTTNNNNSSISNDSDCHSDNDLPRGSHISTKSSTTVKPKMRNVMSLLRSKIYPRSKQNERNKQDRYGFQSNNDEFQPNVGEPLPLLRLADLHSYTLTSSTPTHVCDGKAKPEDQTSDTFILSAASEFLHSTSDDTFAFKHRPRPGIASGRRRNKQNQDIVVHTGTGIEEANSRAQSTPANTELVLYAQSEKEIEQEAVELDAELTISSPYSNQTEPPTSEDDCESQHAQPHRSFSIQVEQKPVVTMPVTRVPAQSKPVRHSGISTKKPSRRNPWKQNRKLPRAEVVKLNKKVRTKRRKPVWNISTRNLATQFYAVRPIESILWPGGRIPQTSEAKRHKNQPRRLLTQDKRYVRQTRSEIPRKQRVIHNVKRQINSGSSAMCAVQHKTTPKEKCWKLYQALFKSEKRKTDTSKFKREPSVLSQQCNEIQSNQRDCLVNKENEQNKTGYENGDLSITSGVAGEKRKRFHLTTCAEEGDGHQYHHSRPNLHHATRLQSKSLLCQTGKSRTRSTVGGNIITTRHLVSRPRLWTSISRAPHPRFVPNHQAQCTLGTSKTHNKSSNALPCSSLKQYPRTNKRLRNTQYVKSHNRQRSRRNSNRIIYDTNLSGSSNYIAAKEIPEKVDFFAYIAVVPSEIDELVLPFRACNRLRTCLKSIHQLLRELELEIAEPHHEKDHSSASNELTIGCGDRSEIESPNADMKIIEHAQKDNHSKTITKKPKRADLLNRLKRTFVKRETCSNLSEKADHCTKLDLPLEHTDDAMNNNARALSVRSGLTVHSDTIRMPQLDPRRVQFWLDVLRDCRDTRLARLLNEMERIYDRRIFAIEQRTNSRIKLDETVIYSIRGLPCMELRIIAYNSTDLQRALVHLQMSFPRLYAQMVFSERFCENATNGSAHRFPTTKDFFFPSTELASVYQPSVSTLRRVIPVIEEARKQRRARRSFG